MLLAKGKHGGDTSNASRQRMKGAVEPQSHRQWEKHKFFDNCKFPSPEMMGPWRNGSWWEGCRWHDDQMIVSTIWLRVYKTPLLATWLKEELLLSCTSVEPHQQESDASNLHQGGTLPVLASTNPIQSNPMMMAKANRNKKFPPYGACEKWHKKWLNFSVPEIFCRFSNNNHENGCQLLMAKIIIECHHRGLFHGDTKNNKPAFLHRDQEHFTEKNKGKKKMLLSNCS